MFNWFISEIGSCRWCQGIWRGQGNLRWFVIVILLINVGVIVIKNVSWIGGKVNVGWFSWCVDGLEWWSLVNGAFVTGVGLFETFLVADGWFCACVSEEDVFGVKVCPTARERLCRGFVDFCVGICWEVLINEREWPKLVNCRSILPIQVAFCHCLREYQDFQGLEFLVQLPDYFQAKVTICMWGQLKRHCVWKELVVLSGHM